MHRFYLPPECCSGSELALTGREAHHALHVVRVQEGEQIVILDGAGTKILCRVDRRGRDSVTAAAISRETVPAPPCRITLLQAVPKGKTFETIVQKATELGTWRIVPVLTERTIWKEDRSSKTEVARANDAHAVPGTRSGKWRQVAIEAIKQCGNPWLPQIEKPLTLRELLSRAEQFDLALVGSLRPDCRHLRDYLAAYRQQHGGPPKTVGIWIGPEGDFTAGELSAIQASGVHPISLGPLVLRTDTAATCCLAILNYELQQWIGTV